MSPTLLDVLAAEVAALDGDQLEVLADQLAPLLDGSVSVSNPGSTGGILLAQSQPRQLGWMRAKPPTMWGSPLKGKPRVWNGDDTA